MGRTMHKTGTSMAASAAIQEVQKITAGPTGFNTGKRVSFPKNSTTESFSNAVSGNVSDQSSTANQDKRRNSKAAMRRKMYARNDHNATLESLESGALYNRVADKAFKKPNMANLSFHSLEEVSNILDEKKKAKEEKLE